MPPFRAKTAIPATPRVISPSPTPSEHEGSDAGSSGYFGPTTRSATRQRLSTPQPAADRDPTTASGRTHHGSDYDDGEDDGPDSRRSRTRSRSPIDARRLKSLTSLKKVGRRGSRVDKNIMASQPLPASISEEETSRPHPADSTGPATATTTTKSPQVNGHLSPPSVVPSGWSWRDFSRSPSPLGLIPIHRHWRTFVHKHEVPRKLLHVSIGFLVLWLYAAGVQPAATVPWLAGAFATITTVDVLRHNLPAFNRIYVRVLGVLMRESEFAGYNGVIFYLLGTCVALWAFPKDVAIVAVLLLSWCDTAASTVGRLYGRYTPRIRRGKSLAGSVAAFALGVAASAWFWGWLAPRTGPFPSDDANPFMYAGRLSIPQPFLAAVGMPDAKAAITGNAALALMSLWAGFAAAASEVVDIAGLDDNLTIPVLSAVGIWGFLSVFGG